MGEGRIEVMYEISYTPNLFRKPVGVKVRTPGFRWIFFWGPFDARNGSTECSVWSFAWKGGNRSSLGPSPALAYDDACGNAFVLGSTASIAGFSRTKSKTKGSGWPNHEDPTTIGGRREETKRPRCRLGLRCLMRSRHPALLLRTRCPMILFSGRPSN